MLRFQLILPHLSLKIALKITTDQFCEQRTFLWNYSSPASKPITSNTEVKGQVLSLILLNKQSMETTTWI